MPIVWELPDGSLATTKLDERFLAREHKDGETIGEAVLRLAREHVQAKIPDLSVLTPILVKTADLPMDGSKSYAWRLSTIDGTPKIIVDATISEPISPAQQARAKLLALDPKMVKPEDLPSIVESLQKVL